MLQDVNKNNVINYTEFLAAAIETQGIIEEYRLAEAFDLMDTDDKGYISRDNLRQILGENWYVVAVVSHAFFLQFMQTNNVSQH
jgi:Ca2+-binding EF-hand superfamily protein